MLKTFVFGVTLSLAIGPIAIVIMTYALTSGFRAGMSATVGSTAADFIYALLAFSAGHLLAPALATNSRLISIVAGLVLVVIGARMAWEGWRWRRGRPDVVAVASTSGPLITTFLLTIANPITIVGFAAYGAQAGLGQGWNVVFGHAIAACAGTFLIAAGMAAAVAGARTVAPVLQRPGTIAWLNMLSGTVIAAFGAGAMA